MCVYVNGREEASCEQVKDVENERMLMGWLKKIMVNTAIDELRRGKMMPQIGGIPDYVWDIKDNSQDAEQLMLYKDLVVLVKELPPNYRVIFNLYVIEGYKHIEIADILGISINTSKSQLILAKDKLRKLMVINK